MVYPRGFHAQIAISRLAQLAKQALHSFLPVGSFVKRSHKNAVHGEHARRLIVVACIEGSCEILSEVPNLRLHVPKRRQIRPGIAVRPVHLTTSWGKAIARSRSRYANSI